MTQTPRQSSTMSRRAHYMTKYLPMALTAGIWAGIAFHAIQWNNAGKPFNHRQSAPSTNNPSLGGLNSNGRSAEQP